MDRNIADETRIVRNVIEDSKQQDISAVSCFYKVYDETNLIYRYNKLMSAQTSSHHCLTVDLHDSKGNNYKNRFADSGIINNSTRIFETLKNNIYAKEESPIYKAEPSECINLLDENYEPSELRYRVNELLDTVKKKYPLISFKAIKAGFTEGINIYANSGYSEKIELYDKYKVTATFCATNGIEASNLKSYTITMNDLKKEFIKRGAFDAILENTNNSLRYKSYDTKKINVVCFLPDAMEKIVQAFVKSYLSDKAIISKRSPLVDCLEKKIFPSDVSISALYETDEFVSDGSMLSTKGFFNKDATIIDSGILTNYCLSPKYESKLGLPHSYSDYENLYVQNGENSLVDMYRNIDKGIIASRIKIHKMDQAGNFVLLVKNGVIIEKGIQKFALNTNLMRFNIWELFHNIIGISKEVAMSGYSGMPWIAFDRRCIKIE